MSSVVHPTDPMVDLKTLAGPLVRLKLSCDVRGNFTSSKTLIIGRGAIRILGI